MPALKSPLIVSSIALLAALSLSAEKSFARDGKSGAARAAQDLPVVGEDSVDDLIYVMPPLKPVKGALAAAKKSTPAVAENPVTPEAAKIGPAPVAPPVAAAREPEPVAQLATPKPANVEAADVETAAKPAEAPKPVAASEPNSAPAPKEAPAAPSQDSKATDGEPAPKATAAAAEKAVEAEAVKAREPVVAPTPKPAHSASIPTQPARKPSISPGVSPATPSRMTPPAVAPDVQTVQKEAAPVLVPEREQVVETASPPLAAGAEAHVEAPAPEQAKETPVAEHEAPAEPTKAAKVETPPETPVEPAVSEADRRIEALLAEGIAGPAEVRLADRATMWLPKDRIFLPQATSRKLATEVGLDLHPEAQGIVAPAGGKLGWLAPIELLDDGHVGTEPGTLDAGKLMAAFEASLPQVNAQRSASNQPAVSLQGWLAEPALDEKHRLSACVNVSTANEPGGPNRFFNCEAWALGRAGAIKVGVADSAELSDRLKGEARAIVGTITFDHGKAYEDFDPAADLAAPYSAGDLLIHDVSPRSAAAPAPAAPTAEANAQGDGASDGSLSDLLFDPLVLAFGGSALALIYLRAKRSRNEQEAEAVKEPASRAAPVAKAAEPAKEPAASAPASGSLFARLLPTLHARFAREDRTAPGKEEPIEAASPAPKSSQPAGQAPAAEPRSLVARLLPTLHARLARKNAAPVVKPENDSDEPAFALKKIAALMKTPNEPAPTVSMSRITRPTRTVGATALAAIEEEAEPPVATVAIFEEAVEEIAPSVAEPPVSHASAEEVELGLVEPGDVAAASAASNAARARRRTDV